MGRSSLRTGGSSTEIWWLCRYSITDGKRTHTGNPKLQGHTHATGDKNEKEGQTYKLTIDKEDKARERPPQPREQKVSSTHAQAKKMNAKSKGRNERLKPFPSVDPHPLLYIHYIQISSPLRWSLFHPPIFISIFGHRIPIKPAYFTSKNIEI